MPITEGDQWLDITIWRTLWHVRWWQGELDRRDARIEELEQWQAEAVEFIKTVECQAAYCSSESDTFPSFADAPLCPLCTAQRKLLEQVK